MIMFGAAIAAATIYLAGLFWLAAWRDRTAQTSEDAPEDAPDYASRIARWLNRNSGIVYGLSIAVYCTSWTFFGGVGTAATQGLQYLPIYLGPFLVFTFGYGLVRKILAQSKAQHSTSIADFLSARYGKSASVAALVTIIATIGSLPYMALQLQSLGNSILTLNPILSDQVATDELVLIVSAAMALFAILFGAGRADRKGENSGLVLTIAVESAVKLLALLAVAALALVVLAQEQGTVVRASAVFSLSQIDARFVILTLIAACAVLCLPRQFHMTFVEADSDRPDKAMRWTFPVYLVIISIVIVPIVLAGLTALPQGTNVDTIVLALPLVADSPMLALLVFIGGFSASVGMIVIASVALSTMITNDLIAPVLFRSALIGKSERPAFARQLLMVRRIVIGGLLGFAYLFYLGFGTIGTLAGLGTLAFAGVAQFAPGLVLGMISQTGNKAGMISGLIAGFCLWLGLLIVPAATGNPPLLAVHSDPLVSGVLISLGANILVYWSISLAIAPSLLDAAQAAAFVGTPSPGSKPRFTTNKRVADIRLLLTQFVGQERANRAIMALAGDYRDNHLADDAVTEMAERTISGVIGASSARMLMGSWSGGDPIALPEVVAMFDETNKRLSFSGELLQIAIENIDQGVALVDADMCLVAWNSRYQIMFDLPDALVTVGTPIAQLIRFNLERKSLSKSAIEDHIERRLDHMRAGREHRIESEQYDGRIMRIVGSPTPGGGYTTSYTDITEDRRAEQALEDKVAERTAQLSQANAALEQATRSKTRFLAAASHDLIQPLNAARLFASALGEEVAGQSGLERLVRDLDGSIISADRLIRALLDISKLDSGGVKPVLEPIALDQLFDEVMHDFKVQAQAKGLRLKRVRTSIWVESDRGLLTSILRNLVSNAIRYTDKGGVLIGVRRKGDDILLCVQDTGRGIKEKDRNAIFDEFNRGASTDREGLGLGLAIVRRSARLIDMNIETMSRLGRGTRFALSMAVLKRVQWQKAAPTARARRAQLSAHILVVDNDWAALNATSALLKKWGSDVICAGSYAQAKALCPSAPDMVIMDYRLDGDERGDGVFQQLSEYWSNRPPAILLTAERSDETEQAALRMSASRLLKPSSPAALRALIANCLSRRVQSGTEAATG